MGRSGQGTDRTQPVRTPKAPGSIAWYAVDENEVLMARDALFEVENDLGTSFIYIERLEGSGDEIRATVRGVYFQENGVQWEDPRVWEPELFALLVAKARDGKLRRAAYSTGWPWNWQQSVRLY